MWMARQVTLKQVASHARVSYQTVSKVINHQIQVSKETEERIWNSIHELGYHPNLLARGLRTQRSFLIGYSWEPNSPTQANPIHDQFFQSMASAAEKAGYHLLAFPYRPGGEWITGYRELIDSNRVDGFVVSGIEFDDPRIRLLQERNFPFVAFGRSNPGWDFPFVDIDGGEGMCQVAKHLVHQGYRRIGVLAWPEASRVGQNRMDGLLAGLEELGVSLPEDRILRGEGVYQFGHQATLRWLDLPIEDRPNAIVAFNDLMAIGAMRAAQERGLQVGKDIAVTGFDDLPLLDFVSPPLTSVRQPVWEVGQRVMSILLELLEDNEREPENVLVEPVLIVRESSSGPSG
jgi:DNA-binding LacI/PurR family transcriptional regulator